MYLFSFCLFSFFSFYLLLLLFFFSFCLLLLFFFAFIVVYYLCSSFQVMFIKWYWKRRLCIKTDIICNDKVCVMSVHSSALFSVYTYMFTPKCIHLCTFIQLHGFIKSRDHLISCHSSNTSIMKQDWKEGYMLGHLFMVFLFIAWLFMDLNESVNT